MEPFKNEFNYPNSRRIGERLRDVYPEFPVARFRRGLERALEPLELKARMRLLADRIEAGLPDDDVPRLFAVLVDALASDDSDTRGLRGFAAWPLTEIVARHGAGYFDEAMAAMEAMTSRFSCEFAIRPFLRDMPERALGKLDAWCGHPDAHVRRLVSEGSRPFLPWGGNLPELLDAPHPTFGLLEKLHADPSDYVRLSVSNHLNDFSKVHPGLVVGTLDRWRSKLPGDPDQEKLARHACRTLLKQGHSGALKLHGYGAAKALEVVDFQLETGKVRMGEKLGYRLVIRNGSRRRARVMFDYAVHHRKANGGLSPKVFKGRRGEIEAGGEWTVEGRHHFKPVTTRVYHPGMHRIEPQINGRAFPALEFTLVC